MQVTLTLDVTPAQLMALLSDKQKAELKNATTTKAKARVVKPTVTNPEQYLHIPGTPTGVQGRPYKLNNDGLAKVWELHKAGLKNVEIAKAFKGLMGVEAIRRLIKKIETKSESGT